MVAVRPPKTGRRRSIWRRLRTALWHNWPSNAPLKDADPELSGFQRLWWIPATLLSDRRTQAGAFPSPAYPYTLSTPTSTLCGGSATLSASQNHIAWSGSGSYETLPQRVYTDADWLTTSNTVLCSSWKIEDQINPILVLKMWVGSVRFVRDHFWTSTTPRSPWGRIFARVGIGSKKVGTEHNSEFFCRIVQYWWFSPDDRVENLSSLNS